MCTAENLVVAVTSLGIVRDIQQIQNSSFIIFFFCGATSQLGHGLPHE